ncbi:uncharacterized protein LOC143342045 [Colletes latitarsis]|uniref:uncharacterized protein LOC143342045 n=1 Tax=Colletes latitarsis TaxID=2605962 RepID=UPI0040364068
MTGEIKLKLSLYNHDVNRLVSQLRMDKEIGHFKAKLIECRKESESTEIEILNVNQLQDKGLFILKDMQRKYKQIEEEMKEIHCEYLKCVNNVKCYEGTVHRKVNSLTLKRDNLKTELANLNKVANENKKKLMDIRKMIEIQEKKNIALLRKLKKTEERTNIPQDLKEKVKEVLSDPRGIKINISN